MERDRRANLRKLYCIPYGSVWKELRSLLGQLLGPGRITADRQGKGGAAQVARTLASAGERVRLCVGFLEV